MSTLSKVFLVILATVGAADICTGQMPALDIGMPANGSVKSQTHSREFWIINGKPIAPKSEVHSLSEYDKERNIIRYSEYGNIERRQLFTYLNGQVTSEFQYFTASGERIIPEKTAFTPKWDALPDNDLCPRFLTRTEIDLKSRIRRLIETCEDKSARSTTMIEENVERTYYRELFEDAKGRSLESIVLSGDPLYPKELRFIVSNLKTPKYSWNITCVNPKFDPLKNLTEVVCTAIHSSKPHEASYQFVERFERTYY